MADEIPHIYYQKKKTEQLTHEETIIEVRGQTLEECQKHFDEILGGVKDE
jgi:hypothetical protein